MTEPAGRIFAACHETELLLRVVGRGTSHDCPALRQFAERCLAGGASSVRIDLAECSHLDSTFVGTLLFLAKHPALAQGAGVQLVAPSPESRRVLQQMAVLRLFQELEAAPTPPQLTWQEISCDACGTDSWQFKQNVVEAHEQLAAVPGPLSDCFRAIAETCRQELENAGKLKQLP